MIIEELLSTKDEPVEPIKPDESKHERFKTDTNLLLERTKTDIAIGAARKTAAREADAEIAQSRLKFDEQLAKARSGAIGSHEATGRELEERRITDQGTDANRKHDDEDRLKARQVRDASEVALFAEERSHTDASLRAERILTDQAYAYAELLLAGEQKSLKLANDALTTRDEFLAVVSHDLRSPLAVISMCASELTKACAEKRLSELEAQWVDTILRHSASMGRLISDLLDVDRIANGSLQLSRMPRDMHSLVEEAVKSFQVWAAKLEINLSADTGFDRSLVAYIDGDRIRQVIDNLITNAMKFTPRGGSVSVRAESDGTTVRVTVTDTGPGIAEGEQKSVFDRFYQVSKGDRRGVGLGLYIAKWIVEAHNGKIWVESKPNSGSSFVFSLPHSHR
jgi:signal transduction histidine kinase